jgi:ribosomal protein L7/L12
MPTKVDFTMSDAIEAIKNFHCLPDDAIISIEGKSGNVYDILHDIVIDDIDKQGKIPAIKNLRNATGLGLKHSKEVVDEANECNLKGITYDFESVLRDLGVREDFLRTFLNK